jgi:hypothetical protein
LPRAEQNHISFHILEANKLNRIQDIQVLTVLELIKRENPQANFEIKANQEKNINRTTHLNSSKHQNHKQEYLLVYSG